MTTLQAAVITLAMLGSGESETVLLDFTSRTCGPCQGMHETIRQLEVMGYPVRRVDIYDEPTVAQRYGVTAVPCFVTLANGKEIDRVIGPTSFNRLQQMILRAQDMARSAQPAMPASPALMQDGSAGAVDLLRGGSADIVPIGRLPVSSSTQPSAVFAERSPRQTCSDNDLIAASVRLRIEDETGHNWGSGTIVDARDGWALILTCGHIFRDSEGKGRNLVDLFGPSGPYRVEGHLRLYDLENDLGLVMIPVDRPIMTAKIAPRGYRIGVGDPVINVGCNDGDDPSVRHNSIVSLDRYLGPANIQVGGRPVPGRSGGGLFSAEGYVIGVCYAADPDADEGLYAALSAIQDLLDKTEPNLAWLYQPDDLSNTAHQVVDASPRMPREMPNVSGGSGTMTDQEMALLAKIHQRLAAGEELICTIHSQSHPQSGSEVLILNHVSDDFLRLLADSASPDGALETSLAVPIGSQPSSNPSGWGGGSFNTVQQIPPPPGATVR